MRLLSTLVTATLAVGALGALAAPAVAAAPVVDISVERTLNTPTDLFDISPTRPADADISLGNLGDTTQAASFTFTVPAGWHVEPVSPAPDVTCGQTGDQYTCTATAIDAGQARSTQLLLTAAPTTPVGSITTIAVTGGPVGAVDSNPTNNATQFRFRNVGTSNVTATLTQSATQVPVGGTVTFTVTLRNNGPDATVGQSGGFRVVTETVDGFRQDKPVGPGTIQEGGGESAPNAGPDYTFDHDLAAGQSATYRVTWTALKLGAVGQLRFASDHLPGARGPGGFILLTSRDVTVTAATPSPAPASATPSPSTSAPELAATGTGHLGGQLVVALIAVVLGAGLTVVARRRRGRHLA